MDPSPTYRTCAIIVTYFTDDDFAERVEAFIAQTDHICIIDNSMDEEHFQKLISLEQRYPEHITLYANTQNNLATAQNVGITYACEHNHDYVLLLDDDSSPAENMVRRLIEAHHTHVNPNIIGLIAPHLDHIDCEQRQYYLCSTNGWWFTRHAPTLYPNDTLLFAIASGSLIPLSSIEHCGMMDESLNIDYVDQDFCLRLRQHNLKILLAPQARLHHRIGNSRSHIMAGNIITATHHSAERRYSIYRNRLRLWWRYSLSFPAFIFYDAPAACYDILRICFYEEHKIKKFRAIACGVWHALCGKRNANGTKSA